MADGADAIGGLTYASRELRAPQRWLSGSGPPGGLRLRLRPSGEEGDGVNIALGCPWFGNGLRNAGASCPTPRETTNRHPDCAHVPLDRSVLAGLCVHGLTVLRQLESETRASVS